MIVNRQNFRPILDRLQGASALSVDTETTGLRLYHSDRLFSIIIAAKDVEGKVHAFYFNFQAYEGLQPSAILLSEHLLQLKELFSDQSKTWYAHNAKFDLAALSREGLEIAGTIHCTQAIERVVYNDHPPGGYDLDSCAERIGFHKDPGVERYIEENKLWAWTSDDKPGAREKLKFYNLVPYPLIVPYGERDAEITCHLGHSQEKALKDIAHETDQKLPSVLRILENERALTKTIFAMERTGLKIDKGYCLQAAQYESDRATKATQTFKQLTGREFVASGKLFKEIFADEKEKWTYTEKGNPSFDSDTLKLFGSPCAKAVLDYRDAKSRSDFFRGFLWHADAEGIVHPTFNPAGAATGRFSSSNPNFQNLTNEEDDETPSPFPVRRAVIPRPGFVFYGRDWSAMEYRMMFDYACVMWGGETQLVKDIKAGKDPHQATADLVTNMGRMVLTRKIAKNGNFAELYGSGLDTLASTIKGTRAEAQALKDALREAAPEVRNLVNNVSTTAKTRGFIRNWAGRRCYLRDPNFAYKMTNYLIQGGTADVCKFTLNAINGYQAEYHARMVAVIHDEIICEVPEQHAAKLAERMKETMATIYPARYLPLTSSGYISHKSLGDLEESA